MSKLIIVESPTKAKTISSFLKGKDWVIKASSGHIRDIPVPSEIPKTQKAKYGKYGVDVENNFDPYYATSKEKGKSKLIQELKNSVKTASELYLATDEDREGEAIAWHLLEVLKPTIPVKRMIFHEITQEAIENALKSTRDIDMKMVEAQETRRILDRLYGFEVSPVLWRKIRTGLSAGRVQSVAMRLVVDQEKERLKFIAANYCGLTGVWNAPKSSNANENFTTEAVLTEINEKKVATGVDFNELGNLKKQDNSIVVLSEADAVKQENEIKKDSFSVDSLNKKPFTRRPQPPFITSTLQQESFKKLHISSKQTMSIAQKLYENGFITYMRTDSTNLSNQAITAARNAITKNFGSENLPPTPRFYTKKVKGAQEAHEAIRPAGSIFKTSPELGLKDAEAKLYDLIYKRTLASQMIDAKGETLTLKILGKSTKTIFSASTTSITIKGFYLAENNKDTKSQEADFEKDGFSQNSFIPKVGQVLDLSSLEILSHKTKPPARYTQATLIAELENRGIGRPSTYSQIISVIFDRGYVFSKGQAIVPTWLAFGVTNLLEEKFSSIIQYNFTAQVEDIFDQIADGKTDPKKWLESFFGSNKSNSVTKDTLINLSKEALDTVDATKINTIKLHELNPRIPASIILKIGWTNPYVIFENSEKPVYIPTNLPPDELTVEKLEELKNSTTEKELGIDPSNNKTIIAKTGLYGPYITYEPSKDQIKDEGKKTKKGSAVIKEKAVGLLTGMSIDTLTREDALNLLSLPKELGIDKETGNAVILNTGRYGPYIKVGSKNASINIEKLENPNIFELSLDQALKIVSEKKSNSAKELGIDKETGKKIVAKTGFYGPYVTDGKINASIKKPETLDTISLETAIQLLLDRASKKTSTTTRKTAKKKTSAVKNRTVNKTTANKAVKVKKPNLKTIK